MLRATAVEFSAPGKVGLASVELPTLRSGELLVRVRACGICMLDVNTFTGKLPCAFPRVAGHEGVGVVEAVGDGVTDFAAGDKVAFLGVPALCEYCVVDAARAVLIPADVTDYPLWVAEPAACVVNGVRAARVEPGDTVVLIGAGYMGLLMVQVLPKQITERFIVIDVDEDRLTLARRYGADTTLNPRAVDAVAEVRRMTGQYDVGTLPEERDAVGRMLSRPPSACDRLSSTDLTAIEQHLGATERRQHTDESPMDIWLIERVLSRARSGADIVIEAAGAANLVDQASLMVRRGGRLSVFSYHTSAEEVDLPIWHSKGLEVQNPSPAFSRSSSEDLRDAVRLLRKGVLDQSDLITHRFPYTRIQDALELAASRPTGYVKAVVTFD